MTEIEGAAQSAPGPLNITGMIGGWVTALDIVEPGWLYAGRATDLDEPRKSCWLVYRSPVVRDADPMYQRLLGLLVGCEVISSETFADPDMLGHTGELSLWELA
ncbi:hypothetical protein KN246_21060 [Mycobacterium intracellulare]|uniref:hypothetical protein n=1 Tax=Mycobacterium intracellulare TaxID=1767 RepID=UPI0011D18CDE|nr:hypothetical protein [Mycobacterium intracellulare]MDM3898908.1 hypothetical protein [Mycobacterium intracellulare]UGT95789.1 hypothetical protein LTQ55_18995 [Mycobacterium intracellulare]UQB96658.1 hypothetical protein KN246_21060 [Mycobacterium intracellulare]